MSMNARNNRNEQAPPSMPGEDTRVRPVALFATSIAAMVGGCILLSTVMVRVATRSAGPNDALDSSPASAPPLPEPRLQAFPQQDLDAMLRQKQQLLQRYDFADRSAGIVRIPIAQAIDLAVERGLKTFVAEPRRAGAGQPGERP